MSTTMMVVEHMVMVSTPMACDVNDGGGGGAHGDGEHAYGL
jgi:hypothetical protein